MVTGLVSASIIAVAWRRLAVRTIITARLEQPPGLGLVVHDHQDITAPATSAPVEPVMPGAAAIPIMAEQGAEQLRHDYTPR
jgi:hypothetical protein